MKNGFSASDISLTHAIYDIEWQIADGYTHLQQMNPRLLTEFYLSQISTFIYNWAQDLNVLWRSGKGSDLQCNWYNSILILAKPTHWPIHFDNIDKHLSHSYHNYQSISVTLCKKTYLKIKPQLKWWKKWWKKKYKNVQRFRMNLLYRMKNI